MPDQDELPSLWDYARSREFEEDLNVRHRASRLLCFICTKDYMPVFISADERAGIQAAYQANRQVICSWSVGSEHVDYITQRMKIEPKLLDEYLQQNDFDESMTNPSERRRVTWFEQWINLPPYP